MKYIFTLIFTLIWGCGAKVPEQSEQLHSDSLSAPQRAITLPSGKQINLRELPYHNFKNVGDTLRMGITEIEPLIGPTKRTLLQKIFQGAGSRYKDKSRVTYNVTIEAPKKIQVDNTAKKGSVVNTGTSGTIAPTSTGKAKTDNSVDNSTGFKIPWYAYLIAVAGVLLFFIGKRFKVL